MKPLAEQLRPTSLDEVVGQRALLSTTAPKGTIRNMVEKKSLRSMILWGPPGVGKTTLARLISQSIGADLLEFSGARAQIKELRDAVDAWLAAHRPVNTTPSAHREPALWQDPPDPATTATQATTLVVFVDEIHRYNKAQQDYFLPWVEQGHFILIGATTENPGFEINSALLSRCALMPLAPLSDEDLQELLQRAFIHLSLPNRLEAEAERTLIQLADGDARRLLGDLESVLPDLQVANVPLSAEIMLQRLGRAHRRFDKGGEIFFDQISALHKSIRGSHPSSALYWFTRMIDGGCDPRYIARRLIRTASEDIGLADPQALTLSIAAAEAYERLGNPEGVLALAQVVVYLAALPKSNAVYLAYKAAQAFVAQDGTRPVPLKLRNAPTKVHQKMGAGAGYRYAHDEANAYAAGERYHPEGMSEPDWYHPTDRGLEKRIADRLAQLREWDKKLGD